jgi:hypothetical protein
MTLNGVTCRLTAHTDTVNQKTEKNTACETLVECAIPRSSLPQRRTRMSPHPTRNRARAPTAEPPSARPRRRTRTSAHPTGNRRAPAPISTPQCRGLHSSNFQLNISAFCGVGGAYVVSGDIRGGLGCICFQKRLRLSWEVDECKPLPQCLRTWRRTHNARASHAQPCTRGLRSSTFRLNVSAFCGIGAALKDCLGNILRAFRMRRGVLGCVKGVLRVRYGSG